MQYNTIPPYLKYSTTMLHFNDIFMLKIVYITQKYLRELEPTIFRCIPRCQTAGETHYVIIASHFHDIFHPKRKANKNRTKNNKRAI